EPTESQTRLADEMRAEIKRGWYIGDMASLAAYGSRRVAESRAEPELLVSLLLSRDKMHHSVGWWRNAEYEFCIHASMAALTRELAASHDRKRRLMAGPGLNATPR